MEPFGLEEVDVDGLQQKMAFKELSSLEITRLYLERIIKLDKKKGGTNAVIEINPDAESIAATLDAERKASRIRSPLHGIPVVIKDNIDTADAMQTTAGSLALEGSHALYDSFVAKKLREAGAVILRQVQFKRVGEFPFDVFFQRLEQPGGQTRNPYALDRTPRGSSSGSAVAVSANFCSLAIGTETDGSIVSPSSACDRSSASNRRSG